MPSQNRHVSPRQERSSPVTNSEARLLTRAHGSGSGLPRGGNPLAAGRESSRATVAAEAAAGGRVEGGGGGAGGGDGIRESGGGEVNLGVAAAAVDEAAVLVRPQHRIELLLVALLAVCLGVANRVLYKLALIPLKPYPFFLAQLTTFGYVAIYSIILLTRASLNIVTPDMLALPKRPFLLMGFLEAVGLTAGMMAAAHMPGALIPVLSQVFLVWQLSLSSLFLGRRYSLQQLIGCFLVIMGVVVVVTTSGPPTSSLSSSLAASLSSTAVQWPLLFMLSAAFPAASSIIKESVFRDSAKKLKGRSLDIFVVNTFGSSFQALFVLLLLPLISSLGFNIPLSQLPAYIREGSACFLNFNQGIAACKGAPLLPLLYVAANLAFNISMLALLKKSSAVVASLAMTLTVPLTVLAFTLPLPLLGQPQPLGGGFIVGALVLLVGLAAYNLAKPAGTAGGGKLKLITDKDD
ncbi:hypothetical protein CLOM_g1276 [Closterium sp. NIES-68]|nr:hypothetical protein CLOM_g1276 [Closterium sp. NIES-68]